MASSSTKNNPLLPTTTAIDPSPPRMEEKLFKGSAMTKRGAYAAISYMSCAGIDVSSSSFLLFHLIYVAVLCWIANLRFPSGIGFAFLELVEIANFRARNLYMLITFDSNWEVICWSGVEWFIMEWSVMLCNGWNLTFSVTFK